MNPASFYPFRSAASKAAYLALYATRARAWPIASETQVLNTPAGDTHVRMSGDPAHPPLVLLHGARGNSLMWVPNIRALSDQYRTFALDTIGDTGLSASRRLVTRPEQLVAWLHEVLSELAPSGPVCLAGLSFGGWLGAQYARQHPERVRKLVLLAPAATVLPVSSAMLARAFLTLLPGITFRRRFYYWLLRDAVESGAAGRAQVDQAVADWALAERSFRHLLMVPANVLDDDTLKAWRVPTLYLVGEHEKTYPALKAISRLKRVAPPIQVCLIPGAGHDLWMVQPEAVNQTILRFLAEPRD